MRTLPGSGLRETMALAFALLIGCTAVFADDALLCAKITVQHHSYPNTCAPFAGSGNHSTELTPRATTTLYSPGLGDPGTCKSIPAVLPVWTPGVIPPMYSPAPAWSPPPPGGGSLVPPPCGAAHTISQNHSAGKAGVRQNNNCNATNTKSSCADNDFDGHVSDDANTNSATSNNSPDGLDISERSTAI